MPPFLIFVLVAVLLVVGVAVTVFLRRRRRAAEDARLEIASTALPQMSEEDIAYRIGITGLDRPVLADPRFDDAEEAAAAAAAMEVGHPDQPWGSLPPAPVLRPTPAPPPAATVDPIARRSVQPAAAIATIRAEARPTKPKTEPPPPAARRTRLWRDSAAVLLVACLALLAVTTFLPGLASHPGPSASPFESAIAIVA